MLAWIDGSWLTALMREVSWLFPAAEIVHFLGLCMLFLFTDPYFYYPNVPFRI